MDEDAVRAWMNTGELYVDQGEGLDALEAERVHGKELLYEYNHRTRSDCDCCASCWGQWASRSGSSHRSWRRVGRTYSVPVHVEDDVWIGGSAVVLPCVTIGAGSVVGAGNVVRPIGPEDQEFRYRHPGQARRQS